MVGRRKWRGSVTLTADVDVDINDILEDIDDETLRDELAHRNIAMSIAVDDDLLDELHYELRRGKVNNALALIESAQNARLVADEERQRQFQVLNAAMAH